MQQTMAAPTVTSKDMTCFQPVEVNMTQAGDVSGENSTETSHSVDGPDMCQKEHSNVTLTDDDNNSRQMAQEVFGSPIDSVGMDLSSAGSKDTLLEKGDTTQGPDSQGMKYATTYDQQMDGEKIKSTPLPDIDVMPSKSLFHAPELFGGDISPNPNVYWLSTEFARLISDKRKTTKTTEEMRREIKAIGLANVDLSSEKPKSVEDIMREYGLEPSVNSKFLNGSMLGIKAAWMPKSKYGITNVSQNNDTMYGTKSEVDDVKANGSSVDGEFDYLLRRHGSNSSFVNVTASRENTSTYTDSKRLSRTPSFSYYDFKNTGSSTNLDSVTSSKANLDIKRIDERSINPTLFFQRERERLQRIDSVISRAPKTSFTSIPPSNPWDLTESSFTALRRTPSQRSSYLTMDQGMRYGENEKDWGNSSPTRAFLERQPSFTTTAKQYSPMSNAIQYQSHDNPVFRDSSSFSSIFPTRHYSRGSTNRGKHSTAHTSKSAREASIPTKMATKQSSPSERSISKSLGESSRGYKASKMKSRQSKSVNNKPKSLDDVDKDDFIVKLMKNYSNSHPVMENEMGLTNAKRDFNSSWQGSEDLLRSLDFDPLFLYSKPISKQQNATKIRKGKYKPYQQNVENMGNYSPQKFKHEPSALTLSRVNMPMTWAGSCDTSKLYHDDDENCSLVKPLPESQTQNSTFTRNSTDGKNLPSRFGSCQNLSALMNYGTGSTNSESSRGSKSSIRGDIENFSSMLNDIEDPAMDDSASQSTNSIGESDLKTNQAEGKTKITKKRKSVVKKKSVKGK